MTGRRAIWLVATALSLAGYILLGYFIRRAEFVNLCVIFFTLFGLYLLLLHNKMSSVDIKLALITALICRISLLLAMPGLTDDYFRFVWDGLLVANGLNPYLMIPSDFIQSIQVVPGIGPALYAGLNSPDYYSVYPAVCQYIFGLSAGAGGGDLLAAVVLMRLLVIAAELGSIALLFKITRHIKAPNTAPLIYALNPLVIVELTGNLHPEAFMIFFLLLALYLLVRNRFSISAVSIGLAAGVKLLPAIFMPLFIRRLGPGKALRYFLVAGLTFAALFIPFFNMKAMLNYFSGLSLYFNVFEFNASIFYLARWLGYLVSGYDTIAITGTLLAIVAFLLIVVIAWAEKQTNWESLATKMLFCLTIYFLMATTVHPWYLTTLVALSALTKYRYALLWSLLVILSYSAYQTRPYNENLWLVAMEYGLLAIYGIYEFLIKKRCSEPDMEPSLA